VGLLMVHLYFSQNQATLTQIKVSEQFYSSIAQKKSSTEYGSSINIPSITPITTGFEIPQQKTRPRLENPLWSIILTGRNDNYGVAYIKRLNNFVKNVGYLIAKYALSAELIITEWNPIEGQPRLADVIDWSSFSELSDDTVRIITVSSDLHNTFKLSDVFSVHEFVGKNVAARRSRGKWLLFSNSDNIFNEDIGLFMSNSSSLEDNCYYRVSRIDFAGNIDDADPSQFWDICKSTAFRIGKQGWQVFDKSRNSFWNSWQDEIQLTAEQNHMDCSHPSRFV